MLASFHQGLVARSICALAFPARAATQVSRRSFSSGVPGSVPQPSAKAVRNQMESTVPIQCPYHAHTVPIRCPLEKTIVPIFLDLKNQSGRLFVYLK